MAKVYTLQEGDVTPPTMDFRNPQNWEADEERYTNEMKAILQSKYKFKDDGNYFGQIYRIPMADSYAQYMVASIRPLTLIHMKVGDEWDSEWAARATVEQVKKYVDGQKNWSIKVAENAKSKGN